MVTNVKIKERKRKEKKAKLTRVHSLETLQNLQCQISILFTCTGLGKGFWSIYFTMGFFLNLRI